MTEAETSILIARAAELGATAETTAAVRGAVGDLASLLRIAPVVRGGLTRAIEAAPPTTWPLLILTLSAYRGRNPDETDEARAAAIALAKRRLANAGDAAATSLRVRLARLLGDRGESESAEVWRDAVAHDPAVAWALGGDVQAEPYLTLGADLARASTDASTRAMLEALHALEGARMPQEREAALDDVRALKESPHARLVRSVLAVDTLERAARAEPGTPERGAALDVFAQTAPLAEDGLAGRVLAAFAAILGGDVARAGAELAASGLGDPPAGALADALVELARSGHVDVREVLRAVHYDALYDPLTVLDVPRGSFSRIRGELLGFAFTSFVSLSGASNRSEPRSRGPT